ncbi:tRNA pseudouridine(38-40) synthase TruA [Shewanella sp. YIC-542]|uniref:tRNA pseudouridine(38-40) synthase TruA n=1 Tax=Shewanella mytili TaxID=3377111 RepID=UPI00398EE180
MRIALGVEYDGNGYFGWQKQAEVDSVQAQLERALSVVANETVELQCAGRTDAGVHATGQVVHFDTNAVRNPGAWTMGVNANLPDNIAVRWVKEVEADFHARFSATARRYRYIIYNHNFRPGIMRHGVSHYHGELNVALMHQAAQYLLGENDFTSFRAVQCQSKTPFRNLHRISVTRQGLYVIVDVEANAFLHHMVRNIVGSLLEVGLGRQPVDWLGQLLALKDRTQAAATAKPHGLYLVHVTYPAHFGLPEVPPGPLFLAD